jgi:CO/xanthine dehydrogenase Mo-binding subunit
LAVWEGGALQVWSSTQSVYHLRHELARAFGLDDSEVTVQFIEGSGCYGHNGAEDATYEAALLARAVPGRPVRLQWSREDEFGWAPCGPASVLDLEAELGDEGLVSAWSYEIWSNGTGGRPSSSTTGIAFASASLLEEPKEREAPQMGGVVRNAEPGYSFPHLRVAAHRVVDVPIRTSSLRSLGAHLNVFANESFMDELAEKAGVDPIEYRLRQLSDPRGRAVIEKVAEQSGWGRTLAPDHGLGIGYARYKGNSGYCAVVAEVEAGSVLRVVDLTIAVDVGFAINPDGVENQVIGGAIQSVSWTTLEELQFSPQRIESVTWDTYPILRFPGVPTVRVVIVGGETNPPLGAGEMSQGPTAAAIGNAIYNAIGLRVRDLPLTSERLMAAANL